MANDAKTLLARKAVTLGQLTRFSIQPFPSLPASFLKRFPELGQYEEDKKKWLENLNTVLAQALSGQKS